MNLNVVIDIISLFIIGSVRVAGTRKLKLQRADRRFFDLLLLTITLIFLTDMPAWLLDGQTFLGARTVLYAVNTVYYAMQIVYSYIWLLFTCCWCTRGKAPTRRQAALFALPMLAEIVLILFNVSTGWIFTLSESNVYHRGEHYFLNLAPYYFYLLAAFFVIFRGILSTNDPRLRRENTALLLVMFLPFCGMVAESFYYGVAWLWPFAALSLLMIYLEVQQQELAHERIASEKREQEARVSVMLSQIQPHFLFNSLTAISQLCEKDPARAKKATLDFAAYLRANIDSLSVREPVAFETELRHIKTYLELEQLRFGEELRVVYDIHALDFRVPPLTVQPLVENAVKHGVGEKENGGTVTISARETNQSYIVTVHDDGVGFDAAIAANDGKTHIGIESARGRIAMLCHGTLEIVSKKGEGTTAILSIPKEEEK